MLSSITQPILFQVLSYLPLSSILSFLQTSKYFYRIGKEKVNSRLKKIEGVWRTSINTPNGGVNEYFVSIFGSSTQVKPTFWIIHYFIGGSGLAFELQHFIRWSGSIKEVFEDQIYMFFKEELLFFEYISKGNSTVTPFAGEFLFNYSKDKMKYDRITHTDDRIQSIWSSVQEQTFFNVTNEPEKQIPKDFLQSLLEYDNS